MTEAQLIKEIEIKTVSFLEWLLLAWSFVWRGLITAIGSMITGGIVGGIIGFILGFSASMFGIDAGTIKPFVTVISGLVGLFIGICFSILLLKWVFKAKFKRFRLTLVEIN